MEEIAVESLLWDLSPTSASTGAELPELGRCGHVAREATSHADDGNRHWLAGRISRGA